MACAPTALRMALDYRAELGPGVPIVFTAVDSAGDFELPRDVTGVLMTPDWMDTLGAALRLQPETRRVVVVSGSSALDKRWVAAARAAFADAPPHLEFTYVTECRWKRRRRDWPACPMGPSCSWSHSSATSTVKTPRL